MASRGARTIRGLGRMFRTIDDSGNRKVDAQEFFVGLNECGCNLTKQETDLLLAAYDTDKDGNVNFDEFLVMMRGTMSEHRQVCVNAAFSKFDADGSGCVTAADLRVCYSCNAHPKVISGEITEDEAFLEFLANFGDKNNDGKITTTEWNDYYSAVSSSIDSDDHFVMLMTQAWKL
jgi:Ca2+-binding EF-hand superfamily protein